MRKWLIVLWVTASLCTFTPPVRAENAAQLAQFKAAIRQMYDVKEAAFRHHDPLPIVMQFYTADATSVGPGDVYMHGRKAFLDEYKKLMTASVRIQSVITHVNGDSGFDWANFYITPDDPKIKPFAFKILFLWEKRRGKWRCIGDMWVRGKFAVNAAKSSK